MTALPLVLSLVVVVLPVQTADRSVPRLDARAERGSGGVQGEGWQHVSLRLNNSTDKLITGRATLYEWDQQAGARPRIVQPFAVSDRQVLHFYPFRPSESLPTSFAITLEDDAGQPIAFDGGTQLVIGGQSTRAIRADASNAVTGDFHIGLWGEATPILRAMIEDWQPTIDELFRYQRNIQSSRQMIMRGNNRVMPEAIPLEQPRSFPDHFIGYGQLQVFFALGTDLDADLSERQRRALIDWVHSGGMFVFVPRKSEQLASSFWREMAGVRLLEEATTKDDSHLAKFIANDMTARHVMVHFLTEVEPGRPLETTVAYEDRPVVYSVPAGNGRAWIVAFDPDSHGGTKRYKPLWIEILNQTMRHHQQFGPPPTSVAAHAWSADSDQSWLTSLGSRFGKFPTMESLAALIVCYLLVIGPVNYFMLKRREARVWLIGTVPVLAGVFGAFVMSMGYFSHGVRATTNQMALAIVSPEGDRAYVEEFVGVYGTTSAEYRLGFPHNLPVRPLDEFSPNPNGGFDGPASFKLVGRDSRTWLEQWRLTFWQTRGTAITDCVQLNGQLRAARTGRTITVSNETATSFDSVSIVSGPLRRSIGPLRASDSQSITWSDDIDEEPDDGLPTSRTTRMTTPKTKTTAALPAATPKNPTDRPVDPSNKMEPGESSAGDDEATHGPEAAHLFRTASARVSSWGGPGRFWVLGLTRQPIHNIESPDTKKLDSVTLYAWPVAEPRQKRTPRE